MNHISKNTLILALVMAVGGLTAAEAQKDSALGGGRYVSDGPQFELFLSSFASDIPGDLNGRYETQLGVRGSFHIGNRLALEGSLSRYGDFDVWFADLSAKYYLKNRGRVGVYAVGGPGWIFGSFSGEGTVHLGVGLEIALNNHLYLRPEARGIALWDDLSSNEAQFSLGVGWRL